MSELYDAVARITDAESFRRFVAALRREVEWNAEHNGPFQAENFDLGSALEAIEGWSTTPAAAEAFAANPWAATARALLAGHYHE